MANKIFFSGDCHPDFRKFSTHNFPKQEGLDKNDVVIICGDFGGIWSKEEDGEERYWLNWLNNKPFTTLFVDGNHENFVALRNNYPLVDYMGGKAHKIRDSIYHLERGYIFDINGKKILAMGGADSHDIQDGIIDPGIDEDWMFTAKRWRKERKMFRIKGIDWWSEEVPNEKEISRAYKNLEDNNFTVDYIVSHEAPSSCVPFVGDFKPTEYAKELEEIRVKTNYDKWFFGHYHLDRFINDKEIVLYDDIVRID